MPDIIHDTPADAGPALARQQAIMQIERRRRFWISTVWSAIGMMILVVIWAMTEYHNAGGWPIQGFSQSSGIHDVWNFWIIYPLGAWLLIVVAHGWATFGHKPISEAEIKREIDRQAESRR